LVVITDSDSLLEPDAIRRAVQRFEVHPDNCMAVGGASASRTDRRSSAAES
jgi:cellulose synthase/poly-beta-1,6-N-acetylglucosamine synthase-like glycosyltransferase